MCEEYPDGGEPFTLSPRRTVGFESDSKSILFVLARYKFAAKMLINLRIADVGCADGFGKEILKDYCPVVDLYDRDETWASQSRWNVVVHDIVKDGPLPARPYEGIVMLDVIEHITQNDEPSAIENILSSLQPYGVFLVGAPTLRMQAYASEYSRKNHVNCRDHARLREAMLRYFANVFIFGMNDEVVHTGFDPFCCYHFALCTGPRRPRA